jgi:membrane protein insertase Oxa1/YidC/SpoIIIJ
MTQQMQIMMPLMFGLFSLQFAAGLSIYFVISNLIRIGQYYVFPTNGARRPLFARSDDSAEGKKASRPARRKR